jgi:transposase
MPTVGIDIGKQAFEAARLVESKWQCEVFSNDEDGFKQLKRWLGRSTHHACLEATGRYGDRLASYLHQSGHRVSIVNPLRIKCYAQSRLAKNKTDKADAKLIAEFAEREPVREWEPLPEEVEQLREYTRRREHLIKLQQMERNRLQAGFRTQALQGSIQRLLKAIEAELDEVERLAAELTRRHDSLKEQYKLLRSIPGIGPVCAFALLAEIGDISRFDSAKQLVAYFGLSPRQRTSGTSVNTPARITKYGNPQIRRVLYMAALSAKQHNPRVKGFCKGLNPKLHKNQVLVAAAHKLLRFVFAVLTYKEPFNPNFQKVVE